MQKKYWGIIVFFAATFAICAGLTGCGGSLKANETAVLTATISGWNEMGGEGDETQELVGVKEGDVIFEHNEFKLTVKSVSSEKIVLASAGDIVETEKGGGINLNIKAPKTLTIKKGEEKYYATQTMDAGVSFTFSYDVRNE